MKVGDKFPVTIAGQVVTHASVSEIGEGEVTLVFVGQKVRMATKTQLSEEPVKTEAPATETIIDAVERPSESAPVAVETPITPPPAEIAQVQGTETDTPAEKEQVTLAPEVTPEVIPTAEPLPKPEGFKTDEDNGDPL